jgi:hypothetical protein
MPTSLLTRLAGVALGLHLGAQVAHFADQGRDGFGLGVGIGGQGVSRVRFSHMVLRSGCVSLRCSSRMFSADPAFPGAVAATAGFWFQPAQSPRIAHAAHGAGEGQGAQGDDAENGQDCDA